MSPPVSILVPTYARTQMLGEIVESYMQRGEPAELVILNDCPLQTLTCAAPGVRVYNHAPLATFGEKRHRLTQLASYDLLCVWDDDDIYLPQFLSDLLPKLRDDEPAARLRHMWKWDGNALSPMSAGTQHASVFRRKAYNLNPWPSLPADSADLVFWRAAAMAGWFRGRHHHEADGHLDCIYRTEPHPQMEGSGILLSEAAYKAAADARIHSGEEPAGTVEIVPRWSRDWTRMANDATAGGKVAFG